LCLISLCVNFVVQQNDIEIIEIRSRTAGTELDSRSRID
jgi:hypothetical protein